MLRRPVTKQIVEVISYLLEILLYLSFIYYNFILCSKFYFEIINLKKVVIQEHILSALMHFKQYLWQTSSNTFFTSNHAVFNLHLCALLIVMFVSAYSFALCTFCTVPIWFSHSILLLSIRSWIAAVRHFIVSLYELDMHVVGLKYFLMLRFPSRWYKLFLYRTSPFLLFRLHIYLWLF